MTRRGRDPDAVAEAIARRQHGVVGRSQLIVAGLSESVVDRRVRKGRLRRLHAGVYAVGPLSGRYQAEMAAVLACGEMAVVSHQSAAALWTLVPKPQTHGRVDVTVRGGLRTAGPMVRVHRTTTLQADETTVRDGIPVTVPTRTLLDLAAISRSRKVEQALARASREGMVDHASIRGLLERHKGRPGTRLLRDLVNRESGPAFVRSEAEAKLLSLVRKAGLEAPATNVTVEGREVDFLWRAARLVVEVDGFEFHSSSSAFEQDRRRDAALTAAGFRVMRVTWRQLTRERESLLVHLAQALVQPLSLPRGPSSLPPTARDCRSPANAPLPRRGGG